MRKFAIAAAIAALPLMLAAPALAAPTSTFKLGVTPNKANKATVLKTSLTYGDTRGKDVLVVPLQFTDITLPKGFAFDTAFLNKKANQCDSKKVQQVTKDPTKDCPKSSLLGFGSAGFVAVAGTVQIPANTVKIAKPGAPSANKGVLVYNAKIRSDVNTTPEDSNHVASQCKGKPTFFIYSNAIVPIQDQRVFPGCFVTVAGRSVIRVPIYKILVAGLMVSVVKFETTIKGVKTGTCPTGGWKSSATTTFRDSLGNPGTFKHTANSPATRCTK